MKWNLKPYTGPPYVFIVKVKGEKKICGNFHGYFIQYWRNKPLKMELF